MLCVALLFLVSSVRCDLIHELQDLPAEHIPYFFTNNPEAREECAQDENCPFKEIAAGEKCWGYEDNCPDEQRMYMPECPGDAKRWQKTKEEQLDHFWKSADFGYVKERKSELKTFCKPYSNSSATLECAAYTRYCRAKNIYLDFSTAKLREGNSRFREDVFTKGQFGAHCELDKKALHKEGEHKSALQSWFGELQHFEELNYDPFSEKKCDITIDKPALIMKFDAGVNMYHHFCDFVNMYMSQHLNNSFTRDVKIIMWDTSPMNYGDFFHDTFKAFSNYPIIFLKTFDNKKLCIKDAVFSLLPRMRYGHYYNMPLIPGCERSSMYRAFSQHVRHRLGVTQHGPLKDKVRITLLERGSKYRNILNQNELVEALKKQTDYEVSVVQYNNRVLPFLEQLQHTQNSDIFLGMHGAGLTHAVFQPDWGVVMEIYNCDDQNCYKDLARLRGVKYMTWENMDKLVQEDEGHHPTLGAHKKFTNYSFDVKEFLRLVRQAADYVTSHPNFMAAREAKYGITGSQARVEL